MTGTLPIDPWGYHFVRLVLKIEDKWISNILWELLFKKIIYSSFFLDNTLSTHSFLSSFLFSLVFSSTRRILHSSSLCKTLCCLAITRFAVWRSSILDMVVFLCFLSKSIRGFEPSKSENLPFWRDSTSFVLFWLAIISDDVDDVVEWFILVVAVVVGIWNDLITWPQITGYL